MALNGVGLSGSIVHAPAGTYAPYRYRAGLGMVPSAEFAVFFDDFVSGVASNVPTGWGAAIIDTGGTCTTYTTLVAGSQGVIQLSDATASEGASIHLPRCFQLTAGKKAFIECKLRTDDVTDNAVQFGAAVLTANTNPEDLWLTAQDDVITLGIVDGAATLIMSTDTANGGISSTTCTASLVVDTWTTLALGYDGSTLTAFKDGKSIGSTTTRIPTGKLLAPFVGHINGNGAGGNTVLVDYFRYAVER